MKARRVNEGDTPSDVAGRDAETNEDRGTGQTPAPLGLRRGCRQDGEFAAQDVALSPPREFSTPMQRKPPGALPLVQARPSSASKVDSAAAAIEAAAIAIAALPLSGRRCQRSAGPVDSTNHGDPTSAEVYQMRMPNSPEEDSAEQQVNHRDVDVASPSTEKKNQSSPFVTPPLQHSPGSRANPWKHSAPIRSCPRKEQKRSR